LATGLGVVVLRFRKGKDEQESVSSYRTWAYPLPPLLYSGIMLWTLWFISVNRPIEAAEAAIGIIRGLASYLITERLSAARA